MPVIKTNIEGVVQIKPARFADSRGYFSEVFKDAWFRENVADVTFVQDNESFSVEPGTVRGLHFQLAPFAQGKLVRCVRGAFFDVAVDIRHGSPTFGKWFGCELSAENGMQLWLPAGMAHGFMTIVPDTIISYKVTAPYSAETAMSISMFALGSPLVMGDSAWEPATWIGMGILVYGVIYTLIHDGLVHQRWFRYVPRKGYLKRLVQAHHLHHATHGKEGGVSFGFVIARHPDRLKQDLMRQKRLGKAQLRKSQVSDQTSSL